MSKIYADGQGWNMRDSAWAVLPVGGKPIIKRLQGRYTNNEMEYKAVIEAMKIANREDEILSDSQLVVQQVQGLWKVKQANLKPLQEEAVKLFWDKELKLTWIPREENKAGKLL